MKHGKHSQDSAKLFDSTKLFDTAEALELVATALGLGSNRQGNGGSGLVPLFGGLEPFLLASNPISKYNGHLRH